MKIPVQIAHPFREGHCFSPVVKGVPTQTTVKCRWPDGSVKHAIFNFVLEGERGEKRTVEFVEGQPVTGSRASWSGECAVEIFTPIDGATRRWEDVDLDGETFIDGPIASLFIIESRTSLDQFRPAFHITKWHELGIEDVRFIGANDNASKVAELWTEVKLYRDGELIFHKPAFPMPRASRWSKRYVSVEPTAIKFDLDYIKSTGAVPNYDTSIKVTESALASVYQQWQAAPKDMTDRGNWTKAMGAAGGRPDIGPYPTWAVLWLYTGDKRMREVTLGNADLAASWPVHFRQQDGKYYSVDDNPTSQLLNLRGVTIVGDVDSWGWNPDLAHQPAPFYLPYLLTGDPFYLEEVHYWASWSAAYVNGAAVNNACGRGPTGKEGGLPGTRCMSIRAQAWAFRSRAEAAWITPDDLPEKEYFSRLTNDAIRIWEGERDIGDLSDPLRAWGQRINPQSNALHFWEVGNSLFWQEPLDTAKTGTAISTWEQSFLMYALGRARELGYPTGPLLDYMRVNIDGFLALDYRLMAAYRVPTGVPWSEVKAQYLPNFDVEANWQAQTINPEHGYGFVAIPAGDLTAIKSAALSNNPKWAILPRQ